MKKHSLALLVCSSAVLLSGCSSDVDSKDIKTSGFFTGMSVTANDDSTSVFVRMRVGDDFGSDTIILSPGDQLSATLSGNIIALSKTASDAYVGSFNEGIGGSEVKVALLRADDEDAPSSIVTLPNAFEITAPAAGETFNAGDSITTTWSPAEPANTVRVGYSINCQVFDEDGIPSGARYGRGFTVMDSGVHSTTINEVLDVLGTQDELVSGVPCRFEVSVERTNDGSLDSTFKGGEITSQREKTVLVNVVP